MEFYKVHQIANSLSASLEESLSANLWSDESPYMRVKTGTHIYTLFGINYCKFYVDSPLYKEVNYPSSRRNADVWRTMLL